MYYRYNIKNTNNVLTAVDAVITTDKFQIVQSDNLKAVDVNKWRVFQLSNNQEMTYTLHTAETTLTSSDLGSGVLDTKIEVFLDNNGIPFMRINIKKSEGAYHGVSALWYLDRAGTPTVTDWNPIMIYRSEIPCSVVAETLASITILAEFGNNTKLYLVHTDTGTSLKMHSIPTDQDYAINRDYNKAFIYSIIYEASDSGNQAVIAAERAVDAANRAAQSAGQAVGAVEILDRSLISR